jgi:protein-disulfide isomerase
MMQNIWAWVVGVAVVGGMIVVAGRFLGDGDDRARRPAPPPVQTESADAPALPKPIASFPDMKVTEDDFVLGEADAPVTIVEYASLTCPYCAQFHTEVLPVLKSEYVETGKARLVYRDFPLDQLALTGSMVARCAGRDRFLGFIDTLYSAQASWMRAENPLEALERIARLGGMSADDFSACLKNQEVADAVLRQRLEGDKTFNVDSTPTIFINGERYGGGLTIPQFRAIIDSKLDNS